MTEQRTKTALTGLQWTVGLVILIEAILFVLPSARHDFAKTHMPDVVRLVLGWGEIIGSVLLLIPGTAIRGTWLLAGISPSSSTCCTECSMSGISESTRRRPGRWRQAKKVSWPACIRRPLGKTYDVSQNNSRESVHRPRQ